MLWNSKRMPRSFAPDRDIGDGYTFTIEFKKHLVADDPPLSLGGYPPELLPELDAAVRRLIGGQIISSALPHAGWLLPPPDDGYLLRYGTDQEGDVRLVVRYDRGADAIISVSQERL